MKIELKNLKVAKFLSEETVAFTATLYVDGKKVGSVNNNGQGGPNNICIDHSKYPGLQEKMEEYAASLPDVPSSVGPLKMDLDFHISLLVEQQEDANFWKRKLKKAVYFRLKDQSYKESEWLMIKAVFSPMVENHLIAKYGNNLGEILNKRYA